MSNSNQWTLLFDNQCALCSKFASFARRFGSSSLSVISIEQYCRDHDFLSYDELMKDVHLLGPESEIYRGKEAAEKIALLFPALKPFRWILESHAGKNTTRRIYASINHFRRCRKCT